MTKFDKIYGGKWLKAHDLEGERRQFQIDRAEYQEIGKDREEKIVVEFFEVEKPFILNPTNANRLADKYGKNETAWSGKWVEAVEVETAMGPGVRLTPIEPPVMSDVPF